MHPPHAVQERGSNVIDNFTPACEYVCSCVNVVSC